MTTEDYVSYPIALALKKAGFDEPCDHCYAKTDESKHEFVCMTVSRDYNKPRDGESPFLTPICSAVPLWQAQKWLREKWGIHVYPTLESVNEVSYDCHIVCLRKEAFRVNKRYSSYESALSAGIAAALELIEKEKE